jgi:release factor glutamine methyltransferase
MILREALHQYAQAFTGSLSPQHAQQSARILLADLLGVSTAHLLSALQEPLPPRLKRRFSQLLVRVKNDEPLAYLLGSAPFHGHSFLVRRSTLIPRPETEELVDHVLAHWSPSATNTVAVDIGTGSGCIAVSLAAERTASSIIATDVSKRALSVARRNAERVLGPASTSLTLLQGSLFSRALQRAILARRPSQLLIAANLPYLPFSDRQSLQRSVTAHEPSRALYAADQGNALIIRCLTQLRSFHHQHASVAMIAWFEFDPPQAIALQRTAEELFPTAKIQVLNDKNGRSRFLEVRMSH